MLKQQESSQWNLGRFLKTLCYFNAMPFLGIFNGWLGEQSSRPTAEEFREKSDRLIFDFTKPTSDMNATWGALDDVVMGGVSESMIRISNGVAIFSGNVSTANSGGFASVRTRNFETPLDLSNRAGIELRVRGDGNRYKFMLRTETKWDSVAYCYSFDTVANTWMTIHIPFDQFVPIFRAKTVKDAKAIDSSRIYALQLMLSKFEYDGGLNPTFKPGLFQIEIESIGTYGSTI